MKLLITGISGFVAGHFLDYIESTDDEIEILGIGRNASIAKKRHSQNKKITCIDLDLLDKEGVSEVISNFNPTHILHLASVSSVGLSWQFPHESFVNNTNIFLNLIEVLRERQSPCRVLSIGSSEEYGIIRKEELPLTETSPLKPANPYAVARVAQEMISQIYEKGYGMNIIMTRSFNHIGPGQSDRFVISSFARQLAEIKKKDITQPIIQTGNIDIIRDFVDVRDVVKAYYLLLKNGKKGEIYNISSGRGFSLKDMLNMMSSNLGIEVECRTSPELLRPIDNPVIYGSSDKLQKELGWIPEIKIEKCLNDMLEWWMEHS